MEIASIIRRKVLNTKELRSFYSKMIAGKCSVIAIIFISLLVLTPSVTFGAYTCPEVSRDSIIRYAKSGVGSPYVWGGHKWDPNNKKWGGADCSGFVTKAWMIPTKVGYKENPVTHYTTYNFYYGNDHWYEINRSEITRADAFVRRNENGGHIVIFDKWDSWGQAVVYEAKDRKSGIIHGSRYVGSEYKAIRRHNLSDNKAQIIASRKMPNGSYTIALPDSWQKNRLYFDNVDSYRDFYITNTSLIENRKRLQIKNTNISISTSSNIRSYGGKNYSKSIQKNSRSKVLRHALGLATSDNELMASAKSRNGYIYQAVPRSFVSNRLWLSFFRTNKDTLYLTNLAPSYVKVKLYLYDAGKRISYHKISLRPYQVRAVNWRRNKRVLRKSKNVFIQIYASRSIMASRRLLSSSYQQAVPSRYTGKELFFEYFNPKSEAIYLANPSAKSKTKVSVTLFDNGRYLYKKLIIIKPRDVISLNLSKTRANRYTDTAVKISSNRVKIAVSKRLPTGHFQNALNNIMISHKLYLDRFDPATELIYVTNPNSSMLTLSVKMYNAGEEVFTQDYDINSLDSTNISFAGVESLKSYHKLLVVLEARY